MNKIGAFCFLAFIALAAAGDDSYYRDQPRKIVYVEKESEYNRPTIEIIKKHPEYKKTVYEYREPEDKKLIVSVVKPEEKKYVVRPVYEPKKDVLVKILDKKF